MSKIKPCQPIVEYAQRRYAKEKDQPIPKYYCDTCAKNLGHTHCDCFQRPINETYNKCFNHSHYRPANAVFKAPPNIKQIAEENEAKRYA